MKLYNKLGILLAASSLALTGCDMDRSPLTSFSEQGFYNDPANVKMALTGLYRGEIQLGVEYSATDWWGYSCVALLDDVTDIGYDRRDFKNNIGKLTSGQINETNVWVKNLYVAPYKRISACCRFLEGLKDVQGAEFDRMRAEARFIRAVQYFYLASYYHDVPLVTEVLTLDESNNVSKSSRKEVMSYAIKELEEVATILPRQKDLVNNELGRATAQAALGYLTRCYMVMEDYANAAKASKQIMDYGDNAIDPDYQKLFMQSGESSSEHIFATQFVDDLLGTGLPQHAWSVATGGWCLVNPASGLHEAYDFKDGTPFSYEDPRFDNKHLGANRDPRMDYTVYYDGQMFRGIEYDCDPETTSADKIGAGQHTQTGFLLRKYFDEGWGGNQYAYGANMPLIRYADILLLHLEAKLKAEGSVDQALLDATINQVRGRATVNMPPITETDPAKLMEIIKKERKVELAFEGWRLWDLYRWGNAKEVLNQPIYGAPFYNLKNPSKIKMKGGKPDPYFRWYVNTRSFKDGQEKWPIPLSEKNVNPNLRD